MQMICFPRNKFRGYNVGLAYGDFNRNRFGKYRRYDRHCSRRFQSMENGLLKIQKNAVGITHIVAVDFNPWKMDY